jgi:hypothetical protein
LRARAATTRDDQSTTRARAATTPRLERSKQPAPPPDLPTLAVADLGEDLERPRERGSERVLRELARAIAPRGRRALALDAALDNALAPRARAERPPRASLSVVAPRDQPPRLRAAARGLGEEQPRRERREQLDG